MVERPGKAKTLETLAVLAAALLVLQLIFERAALACLALGLLLVAVFALPLAARLAQAWLVLSHAIGTVVSKLILGVIFFIFLTPLALLYRVFNRDSLGLRRRKGQRTYFTERRQRFTAKDIEQMW